MISALAPCFLQVQPGPALLWGLREPPQTPGLAQVSPMQSSLGTASAAPPAWWGHTSLLTTAFAGDGPRSGRSPAGGWWGQRVTLLLASPAHWGLCDQGLSSQAQSPRCSSATTSPSRQRLPRPRDLQDLDAAVGMGTHGPSAALGDTPRVLSTSRTCCQTRDLPDRSEGSLAMVMETGATCQDTSTPGALPAPRPAVAHVPSCGPRRAA